MTFNDTPSVVVVRYKRGFKHVYDVDAVDGREVRACIQILYGCMLKLYPRGSKTPTFGARVHIVCRIQQLLELPVEEQLQFVSKYAALVKLCLMEYCYNVLLDFFPVEYSIISEHPSMAMYDTTARVMFDTFRRDIISSGLETWELMDTKAASSIERCMRMCKFKMNRNTFSNVIPHVSMCSFDNPVWGMRSSYGDAAILHKVYPDMDKTQIALAHTLQTNIMVYALPWSITAQQKASLHQNFGSCDSNISAVRYQHICSTCALNGKGFNVKMRMCGLSGKLMCDECTTDSILRIDMLGVVLSLCQSSIFMCPTCCKVRMWTGSGSDFSSCTCGSHSAAPDRKQCCSVCSSRYVVVGPLLYPDPERNRMTRVYLCGKHVLSKHVRSFIHCYRDFQTAIRNSKGKRTTLYSVV